MDCDVCKKALTEDNTYERIICLPCKKVEEKTHCIQCRSLIWFANKGTKVKAHFRKHIIKYANIASVIATLYTLHHFFSATTEKLAIGVGFILAVAIVLFSIILGPFHLIKFIDRHLSETPNDLSDGPEKCLAWFVGVILIVIVGIVVWFIYILGNYGYIHWLHSQ